MKLEAFTETARIADQITVLLDTKWARDSDLAPAHCEGHWFFTANVSDSVMSRSIIFGALTVIDGRRHLTIDVRDRLTDEPIDMQGSITLEEPDADAAWFALRAARLMTQNWQPLN